MSLGRNLAVLKTLKTAVNKTSSEFKLARHLASLNFNHDKLVQNYTIDRNYYLNPENRAEILHNIKARKLKPLQKEIEKLSSDKEIDEFFEKELESLPVQLDDKWLEYEEEEKLNMDNYIVEEYDSPEAEGKPKKAVNLGRTNGILHTSRFDMLGTVGGSKSYAFLGDLTYLQKALVDWTFDVLINEHGFIPVTVPHLAYESVVKACGYSARRQGTQIFTLKGHYDDHGDASDKVCLIGTSEIPLAAMHLGETFQRDDLPKKYCAVSRCYRAEFGQTHEDSGIYRVPYFTKVEMFAFTTDDTSDYVLNEFVLIQKELFSKLNLRFRILDMPPPELGINASRKFDCEAWFPGPLKWGEISSASNCKDYQSRRLNIKYQSLNESEEKNNEPFTHNFVHTVNATAMAIPRMISLILEYGQDTDGVHVPVCLQPYMKDQEKLQDISKLFLNRSHK